MRVALDTNVLVSGLMSRASTCAIVLDLVSDGRLTAALDGRIMNEYQRVCAEPRLRLDADAVQDFLRFLDECAEYIVAPPLQAELPDLDDRPFLEVAAEAQAILVTGNLKHFPRKTLGHVQVVSPVEFLNMFRSLPEQKGIAEQPMVGKSRKRIV